MVFANRYILVTLGFVVVFFRSSLIVKVIKQMNVQMVFHLICLFDGGAWQRLG